MIIMSVHKRLTFVSSYLLCLSAGNYEQKQTVSAIDVGKYEHAESISQCPLPPQKVHSAPLDSSTAYCIGLLLFCQVRYSSINAVFSRTS